MKTQPTEDDGSKAIRIGLFVQKLFPDGFQNRYVIDDPEYTVSEPIERPKSEV